jgi:hypothetical protein
MGGRNSDSDSSGRSYERRKRAKRCGAVYVLCIFFIYFLFFFGGLECAGHSYAYVAHLLFLRDVWIRTQKATIASRRANSLATHPSSWLPVSLLSHPSPYLATQTVFCIFCYNHVYFILHPFAGMV